MSEQNAPVSTENWCELLVKLMTELGRYTGTSLVGEDEGDPDGDKVSAIVRIGHLPGRWWVIIEESDSEPVIATTDGEVANIIWFHDDGHPFRDELMGTLERWRDREGGAG